MKSMPSRDTSGKCKGECRDLAYEGEQARQRDIDRTKVAYSAPAEKSPAWTFKRNDPPGSYGGRI